MSVLYKASSSGSLHWQGGDHTALKLRINGVGKHRWTVPEDTLSLIRELARLMPDQ